MRKYFSQAWGLLLILLLLAGCATGGDNGFSQEGSAAPPPAVTAEVPVTGASPSPPVIQPTETLMMETSPTVAVEVTTASQEAITPTLTVPVALPPTAEPLACTAPAPLTPAMTEGPYYKPDAPERTSLIEEGMTGTRLLLTGYVVSTGCQPIPNALVDFWQTDAQGEYDNAGYRMRGRQFTDENGRYTLETVIPGEYPGRTAHIHVKVQAPGGQLLTSQLFIPGAAGNQTDRIFDQSLVITLVEGPEEMLGTFDFVVPEQ